MALGYVCPNQDQVVLHDFVRIDDVYRRARVEGQLKRTTSGRVGSNKVPEVLSRKLKQVERCPVLVHLPNLLKNQFNEV